MMSVGVRVTVSASMRDTDAQPFDLARHGRQRHSDFVIHRAPF